jgi:spore germination cell wall hydrolase CwlJ-like protein
MEILTIQISARVTDMRALVGAAALGSLVGLSIGGAYLAGGLARTAVVHARITRLADAAHKGFSDTALAVAANDAPGALAIARRHDPLAGSVQDARERRLNDWADQLQARHGIPGSGRPTLLRASLDLGGGPVAVRPFTLRGALDQSRDLECLTQAVYYESRGETPSGMQAVAQVVLNRVRHRAFPKTICGVVFQGASLGGCQFSFACDGSVDRATDPVSWRRSQDIAAKALDGRVMAAVGNATYFHTAAVTPDWSRYLVRIGQVGGHLFYRFAGRNGASSMFNGTVEPSESMPAAPAVETPVYASLGPSAPASAPAPQAKEAAPVSVASLFISTATQAVEHAAAAASGVAESARAPAQPPAAKAEAGRAEDGKGGGSSEH